MESDMAMNPQMGACVNLSPLMFVFYLFSFSLFGSRISFYSNTYGICPPTRI